MNTPEAYFVARWTLATSILWLPLLIAFAATFDDCATKNGGVK